MNGARAQTNFRRSHFLEKEDPYRTLVRTSPDIIYVLDLQSKKVTFKNRSLWEDLGYEMEQVDAPNALIPQQFLHPDDMIVSSKFFRHLRSLRRHEVYQATIRLMARSGRWRHFQVRLSVMEWHMTGKPKTCMGVLTDITSASEGLRIMEEARKHSNHTIATKTMVISQLSHELRTPMGCIVGAASLLEEEHLSPKQAELVEKVLTAGKTFMELLDHVLEHGQLDAGERPLNPEPIDFAKFLKEVTESFAPEAKRKGLAYAVSYPTHMPESVLIDPISMRRVMTNLIANALKYTQQGTVSVRINGITRGNTFVLKYLVNDTGIGIDEELQPEIFESFTRGQETLHKSVGGVGLGLSICKALVEQMDGHIWCHSTPGRGSTFKFEVPLTIVGPAPKTAASQETSDLSLTLSPGIPNVLMVDDNPECLPIYKMMIEAIGAKCLVAKSGKQAISKCRHHRLDLVFMDCQMPDVDGFTATEAIRKMPSMSGVPIVALTAHPKELVEQRALQAGMNDLISKPVKVGDLRRILQTHGVQPATGK